MAYQHNSGASVPNLMTLRPAELDSMVVTKKGKDRTVTCFCGASVRRSVVPHLRTNHPSEWKSWVSTFVALRGLGYPLKKIMRHFKAGNGALLFSWTVVDREIRACVESGEIDYSPPPIGSVQEWEPDNFALETTTVWDFPIRGRWAVHKGDYRGNWPPQLVRNLILRYTAPGDSILDTFYGGGTTLIEAWLLGRPSVGIDLSKLAYQTTATRLLEMESLSAQEGHVDLRSEYKPLLIQGDSTLFPNNPSYSLVAPKSVDLLCIHPPYLNVLTYTDGHQNDLSQVRDPDAFLQRMADFAKGIPHYLSSKNVCALLMGDVRRNGFVYPLSARTIDAFLTAGFQLNDVIIKIQHRDRSSEFYASSPDSYMLAHETLYIFHWPI